MEIVSLLRAKGLYVPNKPSNQDDVIAYAVYPMRGWKTYVKKHGGRHNPDGWMKEYAKGSIVFDKVMSTKRFGFELDGVGGHPCNFDFSREYGDTVVMFCYWGNPYHC